MHIYIPLNHQWTTIPRININDSIAMRASGKLTAAQYTPASSVSVVTISAEANALSKVNDGLAVQKADRLREQISKIDFHNTTQAELGDLVSTLVKNREITPDQAAPFISAATDVIPPRGRNEKFDLTKHFEKVKSILDNDSKTDPTLRWGASYAAGEIDVLNNIRSFAKSTRLHVMRPN